MALNGGRAAPTAYVVLAGLVVLAACISTLHGEWVSDSWIHLGAIRAMSKDFWSPAEPLVGEDVPFPYFSPWTAVGALAAKLFSLTPQQVLAAFGILSPIGLVHALHRFVRAVTPLSWAPVAVLAALVTVWGTQPFFWSGFLSLNTLVVGSSWPSVLATAMWFYLWAAVWSSTRTTPALAAALVVVPGLLLLVHPFTFLCTALACGVTVLLRWEPRRWLGGATFALCSVGLASVWPWTSLTSLLANPRGFDEFHVFFYEDVRAKFGLLLLTLPALAIRWLADRRDPLVWCAAAGVTVWAAGGLVGVESLGRVLPLATTSATVALGVAAAGVLTRERAGVATGPRPVNRSPRSASRGVSLMAAGCWVIAVGVGAGTQSNAWSRVTPDESARRNPRDGNHLVSPYPGVDRLLAQVPESAVVLAAQSSVARQLPAHGLLTVAPQWPSPGVRDAAQRAEDEAAILAAGTPLETRRNLIDRYGLTWVVWPTKRATPAWLTQLGVPAGIETGQQLFELHQVSGSSVP